jgi:hypothetical protein
MTEYLDSVTDAEHAMYGPFFGSLGVTAAMIFTAAGSAYGTAKSGYLKISVFLKVIYLFSF